MPRTIFPTLKKILFHATYLDHYRKIIESKEISPHDGDRPYGMLRGANEPHGISHIIKAVSLFENFDRVGDHHQWPILSGVAVYVILEIDREKLSSELINCKEAERRIPAAKNYKCIQSSERLHLGPIPVVALKRAILVHSDKVFRIHRTPYITEAAIQRFQKHVASLPKPKTNPLLDVSEGSSSILRPGRVIDVHSDTKVP
jgi:hypothetical protein